MPVPSSTSQQPVAFDSNGDMLTDLLGYAYNGYQEGVSGLSVWKNVHSSSNPGTIFEV